MMRGRSVRTIAVAPAGVSVALSDGTALTADALFLATGKHELRGHARPRGTRDRFIGLKMHLDLPLAAARGLAGTVRSEEHTSELQSLMRISYAVFCLKKKIHQ